MKVLILAVPKNSATRRLASLLMEETNCVVEVFHDEASALQWLEGHQGGDMVIVHQRLIRQPQRWLKAIKLGPHTGYWVVLGPSSVRQAVAWMRLGADFYVEDRTEPEEWMVILKRLWREPPRAWITTSRTEQTLLQVIREISRSLDDLDKLFNIVMDAVMEISQADYGALLLYNPQTRHLEVFQHRGSSAPVDATWGFMGFEPTVLNTWFQRPHPTFLANPRDYESYASQPYSEVRSALICPILTGTQPIGGLVLCKTAQGRGNFTQSTLHALQSFAHDLGPVLRNALLHMQAQELSFKDDLTDAYNRRYFERFFEEEIRRAERFGARLSIIFIDLDNLKAVNEQYGHLMGSKVLQEVAHRMILAVRGSDRVVRYGGDEFCVILPETDTVGALQVAERLRQVIASRPFLTAEGLEVHLTASLGIATYPVHGQTKEELVQAADRAMFDVKSSSKNGVAAAPIRAS